jgi:hypothetical protein
MSIQTRSVNLTGKPPRKRTPSRIRPSIKKDAIHPSDYLRYEGRFSCDECTHFNPVEANCTIGYNSEHHRLEEQKHQYSLSGKIAFCRFHEID